MISLVHRTVFIHIPKCAGQSIEAAFCADLGLKWQRHRYLLGCFERPPGWPKDLPDRLAHLSAKEYVAHKLLPEPLFRAFYTFAIIRDPVERAVSMWRFLKFEGSFAAFVTEELPRRLESGHFFYRAQEDFLVDPDTGALLVDHVVPLSDLSEHWPEIMRRAGLNAPLGHRNAAPDARPRPEVTDVLAQRLRDLYAGDYRRFDRF